MTSTCNSDLCVVYWILILSSRSVINLITLRIPATISMAVVTSATEDGSNQVIKGHGWALCAAREQKKTQFAQVSCITIYLKNVHVIIEIKITNRNNNYYVRMRSSWSAGRMWPATVFWAIYRSYVDRFIARRFLSSWWWKQYVPLNRRFLQQPHGVTSQKSAFFYRWNVWQGNRSVRRRLALVPL
jgi:hypothetical protein